MKRAEIKKQISDIIKHDDNENWNACEEKLTALFIQLSEERAKQQNIVCMDLYVNYAGVGCYESDVANLILNAPFPTLD